MYDMNVSFDIGALKPNFESALFKEVVTLLTGEFGDLVDNPNFYNEYKKTFNTNDAVDYQLNYSVKLAKELVQELMNNPPEEKEFREILSDLLTSTKTYSFKAQENAKSPLIKYKGAFEL